MARRPSETDAGKLIYPSKGDPPEVPEGYVADPGNPYVLEPIYPPCKFRIVKMIKIKCCDELVKSQKCSKSKLLKECKTCTLREE